AFSRLADAHPRRHLSPAPPAPRRPPPAPPEFDSLQHPRSLPHVTIRQIAFLVITALIPCGASAQAVKTTSVTINATDSPDAQAWANGTYVTSLVINPGT